MGYARVNIEDVCDPLNIQRAVRRVGVKNGAAGIDGVIARDPRLRSRAFLFKTIESITRGDYRPSPTKRVAIAKSGGGHRLLGIPTVRDRVTQQAVAQVLGPVLERLSSEFSFAYRRGRGPADAVRTVRSYAQSGCPVVADLDIVGCFDHLPHRLILDQLSPLVDGAILDLVQRFLKSGIRVGGKYLPSDEGTPQGGPLSPQLCNVALGPLDRQLEAEGLRFVRFADDIKILMESETAAMDVVRWLTDYLLRDFNLRVHPLIKEDGTQGKSKVIGIHDADILGFSILPNWELTVAERRIPFLKLKLVHTLRIQKDFPTWDSRLEKLNKCIRGWIQYYDRHAYIPLSMLIELDEALLEQVRISHANRYRAITGLRSENAHVPERQKADPAGWRIKVLHALGIYGFLETASMGSNRFGSIACPPGLGDVVNAVPHIVNRVAANSGGGQSSGRAFSSNW